jgi:hypothetical protein
MLQHPLDELRDDVSCLGGGAHGHGVRPSLLHESKDLAIDGVFEKIGYLEYSLSASVALPKTYTGVERLCGR